MKKRNMKKKIWMASFAVAIAVIGSAALWQSALADTPTTIRIAIPVNVEIVVGQSHVLKIGEPTSISPVNCAPGTPFPQTAVVLDPGGGRASQITGALFFHDHEITNGTRYLITAGPDPCNTDFKLYTGTEVVP